jgi:hypothetical protein
MESLDQGNLHPKLEVPRLRDLGRESNLASVAGGEYSSKEIFEKQFGISTYEPLTWIPPASPGACGYMNNETWYMNIHELH